MRDLRKYARQTRLRLIAGSILLVFTVGLGLIYAFYGPRSALLGLICLLTMLIPLGLIALVLWAMERFVDRANQD